MKILIDCQALQTPSKMRGIGNYLEQFLEEFVYKFQNEIEIGILLNTELPIKDISKYLKSTLPHVQIVTFTNYFSYLDYYQNPELESAILDSRNYSILRFNPDFYLTGSLFEGFDNPAATSLGNLNTQINCGLIYYDAIPLRNNFRDIPNSKYQRFYEEKHNDLFKYSNIFCISEGSQKDLENFSKDNLANSSLILGGAINRQAKVSSQKMNLVRIKKEYAKCSYHGRFRTAEKSNENLTYLIKHRF